MKGTVEFGRVVTNRRYNTVRLTYSEEFDLERHSHSDIAKKLQQEVDKFLEDMGLRIVE